MFYPYFSLKTGWETAEKCWMRAAFASIELCFRSFKDCWPTPVKQTFPPQQQNTQQANLNPDDNIDNTVNGWDEIFGDCGILRVEGRNDSTVSTANNLELFFPWHHRWAAMQGGGRTWILHIQSQKIFQPKLATPCPLPPQIEYVFPTLQCFSRHHVRWHGDQTLPYAQSITRTPL